MSGLLVSSRNAAHTQVGEDLGADAVVADVGGQAHGQVGVDNVGAGLLQLVGLQLVQQADPPALVPAHVEHDAAALGGDGLEGGVEQSTAAKNHR